MFYRLTIPCLLALLFVVVEGCSVSPTYIDDNKLSENSSDKEALNPVHFKMDDSFKTSPPQCIAILPLINKMNKEQGGNKETKNKLLKLTDKSLEQLRWSLYSQLAPYPYNDVELATVNKVLASVDNKTNYAAIGKALKCDALLLGEVTDYHSEFFGIYSDTAIGVNMKLIRAKNGNVLWEGSPVATNRGGGVPFSPIGLIVGLYSATENLSDEQLVRVEDDVFRRLLSTWDATGNSLDGQEKIQLAEQKPQQDIPVKEEAYPYVIAVKNLYLRAGPGTKFKAKTVLSQQDKLAILDQQHLPWLQVKVADGQLGYVNKKYIRAIKIVLPKNETLAALDK